MRRLIQRLVRIETVAVLVIAWLAGALGLGVATGAGAVPTAALMALGLLLGGLLLLIRHSLELASRIGNLASQARARSTPRGGSRPASTTKSRTRSSRHSATGSIAEP